MIDRNEKDWYRDAIIYQLHVKSFFDSDNTGVGDFEGVTQKLDYIRDLGANTIWLMPFYPSPLRDDGYDIADYRGINPSYGSMRDFRRFVREAHERGLRVITELVINHTSDQHPWFQRARKAKPGSAARDFYVWSQTDQVYKDARIIFLDTESSNWTFDPVAKAYYWHRFYSHQPDLNFDNPRVLEAVIDIMYYWLDMGVDGLRLDAIPYLIERDGTNCENLPETHEILRKIRAALDARYPDRMLLAEANQWPEETAQYLGKGDECHMAFHFPLMPRMYMALGMEDRHPITDIMRQTPEIPEGTQWAIFLRNHDELTLEMVTDRERDYLWSFYANDRRARINLGIRRRLAPLLENDRRKIELLNSLLFTMPGTPVLYYGDEIGMGDNIYLGDRDGVRTPMQWSPDRNGGFSRADPARLFLPAIQDPIYGFNSVNVEAQLASSSSLLNWTRRMIAVRRRRLALSRGSLRFLYPANRKVLAYLREFEGEVLLCVANMSRAPQAVELELGEFKGATPVELSAGSVFPPVGGLPYLLTLPGHGFYWFQLERTSAEERFGPTPAPELFTLVLTGGAEHLLEKRERQAFERAVAPRFLAARRWFAGKDVGISSVTQSGFVALPQETAGKTHLLVRLAVTLKNGATQSYFTPLTVDENREDEQILPYAVARVRRGSKMGLVFDADADPSFGAALIAGMQGEREMALSEGARLRFGGTERLRAEPPVLASEVRRVAGDQSNTSLAVSERMMLKIYRRLVPGINPEVEMGRFLTDVAGFKNAPALLGTLERVEPDGVTTALCILQTFVRNQGDAWGWTVDALKRGLETLSLPGTEKEPDLRASYSDYLPYAEILGRRTAEMHVALVTPTRDPAFAVEPLSQADLLTSADDSKARLRKALAVLDTMTRDGRGSTCISELMSRGRECEALLDNLAQTEPMGLKSRVHGDYHLGQVLIVKDDVLIVDFEGEPARSLEQRRAKDLGLRDVAGMLRSFDYAAETAARDVEQRFVEHSDRVATAAQAWRDLIEEIFLEAYDKASEDSPAVIADRNVRRRLLDFYLMGKAIYEIAYEAANRPSWIDIPVRGLLAILNRRGEPQ
ncbi:MAG: trehalose synthase [Hyphomicrobiales bacterium]|nr:trehalose synthase [Hyphomicrobiales bacterium]